MATPLPRLDILEAKARRYPDLDPVACEAYLMLRHVGDAMRWALEERISDAGISHGRFMLLVVLDRQPDQPMAASELADEAGVTKQTITSLLDGLEKDGYVLRQPHPQDRRSVVVQLREAGRQFLHRILPGIYRKQVELLDDLTHDEMRLMTQLLRKVQEHGERAAKLEERDSKPSNE